MSLPSLGRLPAPWRLALVLSLALHGLAVLAVAVVPYRQPAPRPAVAPAGGAEVPAPEEASESVCFLVGRPRVSQRNSPPTPPAPSPPPATAPVPVRPPAEIVIASPPDVDPPGRSGPGADRGPGTGDGSGTGTTEFFRIAAPAKAVVYVIDRSASMGLGGRLDAARRELRASLEQLPATARFQVIVYNSTACPLLPGRPGWLAATPENKQVVAAALAALEAEGGTRHEQALPRALALQPDVVFFLTDADDLTEDYLRLVAANNRSRSVIHVIELSTANRGRAGMPLQALARQNGGRYQAVDPANYR